MSSSTIKENGAPAARPAALLPLDHPLCYTHLLSKDKSSSNHVKLEGSSWQQPKTTEEKLLNLYERQAVVDVLNNYAYYLDSCMVDSAHAHDWAGLFTPDCEVTYPFGTQIGQEGLAKFGMKAELRFFRMNHLSSNFAVIFTSPTKAYARSILFAAHSTDPHDLGQNFFEGGYYYWNLEKINDQWKISKLFLDAVWWLGDSLGLNEPHEPEQTNDKTPINK